MVDGKLIAFALLLSLAASNALAKQLLEIQRVDVNGDGIVDTSVVIKSNAGVRDRIFTRVYSGADGHVLYTNDRMVDRGGDFDGDGIIDVTDLAMLLYQIGDSGGVANGFDVSGDGIVDAQDVLLLIESFGTAPQPVLDPCNGEPVCEDGISCPPCQNGQGTFDPPDEGGIRGGGGGGNPPDDDDDPPPPDCELEILGANYMPVHGGAGFAADLEGGGVEIVWTVISGESLLESFEISNHPGFGPIAIIKAGGTPGTVRLKAMLVVNGEIACEADHEVRIEQYDEINVRYQAFIECPILKARGLCSSSHRTFSEATLGVLPTAAVIERDSTSILRFPTSLTSAARSSC